LHKDGCIRFASVDTDHLENLQCELAKRWPEDSWARPGGTITFDRSYATLTVRHRPYYCSLVELGITSRKTWNGIPWLEFSGNQRHFVRGFTDGDGSIHTSYRHYGVTWNSSDKLFL
jgi:hypothetical protein